MMPLSAHFFAVLPPASAGSRTSFAGLPPLLKVYIALAATAAAVTMAAQAATVRFESPTLFVAVLITSVLLSATKVRLPRSGATVSLSYVTNFAALTLFSQFEATVIIAVSVWSQCVLNTGGRTSMYRTVFSVANIIMAAQAASSAADLVGGLRIHDSWPSLIVPTLAGATAFFFCNTLMLAEAVGLESRKFAATLWRQQFLWSAPACFVGAFLGTGSAYLLVTASRLSGLVAIPLVLFYWGYRTYLNFIERQDAMHMATVEALARAIGARDQTLEASRAISNTHVQRVQRLAVALAQRAGMSQDEVKGVEVAALLHDIGKLAVPEHILNKPGRLTPEEYVMVKTHPTVGAEIIGAVDFGYPVAPLIASHHERWNGEGYPKGLRGTDIPLGSRVLGIVDYFDALVADRPYHKALPEREARGIIRGEAGQVLDPDLVELFLDILEEETPIGTETTPIEVPQPPAVSDHGGAGSVEGVQNAIENIARANTEMVALYAFTEAMGHRLSVLDTMALLASKLAPLVPASSWALFVCDETTGMSRCEFATGLDSEQLRTLEVPAGTGAIGYMVRLGKTVRNAHPDADFNAMGLPAATTSLRSMLACPLLIRDRTVGALAAYHVDPDHFTQAHASTIEKVAPKAAIVVHDARAFEKVRTESLTDPLTSLHNSRALTDHLEMEMSKADRFHSDLALLVIDVDRFKTTNDRFGHPAGDRALQFVARAIRGTVRGYDFCARQGGDEFVVVLQECDEPLAKERALEIQEAVCAMPFEAAPGVAITLGISVGHAMYPNDGASFEALLRQADQRMYQNKFERKLREHESLSVVPASLER